MVISLKKLEEATKRYEQTWVRPCFKNILNKRRDLKSLPENKVAEAV